MIEQSQLETGTRLSEEMDPHRHVRQRRRQKNAATVNVTMSGMRHRFARRQIIETHFGAAAPFVAIGTEQGLKNAPDARRADGKAVEEAERMRILPGIDAVGEGTGPDDKAKHGRTVITLAADRKRTPHYPAPGRIGCYRPFQGPVDRSTQIHIQCIGFAFGQDGNGRPAIAENRLPHGQHVADSSVAAAYHEEIDTIAREVGQRMSDIFARTRLNDGDIARCGAGKVLAFVAMAARIVDDADTRRGNTIGAGPSMRPGSRHRGLPQGQAVKIVD